MTGEKMNIQAWISGIRKSRTGTVDAHTDTADQIAHAHQHARPEERVSRVVVARAVDGLASDLRQLRGEDDGHDDAVDRDDFAEDDGDQVLRPDPRGFHATSQNRCARYEDAPESCSVFFLPLFFSDSISVLVRPGCTDHAAPTTERPIQRAMPVLAHAYGDIDSRNWPTCGIR